LSAAASDPGKALYTGEFCAFSEADAQALTQLLRRVLRPGCRAAEVGSWLGNGSTLALLRELSTVADARLLCVDTWRGNPGNVRHSVITERFDVLGTFRRNTAAYADRLDILVADSLVAASLIRDGAFDLAFIDADHTYAAVKADIAAWRLKVRVGGILCGHDCESRVTPELAARIVEGRDCDTVSIPGFKFANLHAGCVLAVHEAFDGTAELFAETGASTVWAVAR
jgi:predicted O-methyltransferase YrrM